MNARDQIDVIAISALLHDIGKLVRRSAESKNSHVAASEEFLKNQKQNLVPKILSNDEFELIGKLVKYHHICFEEIDKLSDLTDKEKDMLKILIFSDWDSASERVDYSRSSTSAEYSPLHSILSVVNFAFEVDEVKNTDELEKLLSEVPAFEPNVAFEYQKPEVNLGSVSYQNKNILDKFKNEFKNLCKNCENKNDFVIGLNYLLKKYTTFTTSSGKERIRDISLYHHSFTTAAFAVCRIIEYLKEGNVSKNQSIGALYGRLFKIQDYIFFGINSKIEKPMRRILTRSQLVSILNMLIPFDIVKSLNLYPFNIIFYGGGTFLIFLPPSFVDLAKNRVKEISKRIIELFEGKVYFEAICDKISVTSLDSSNRIIYNTGNELKELAKSLSEKKFQRSRFTIPSHVISDYYQKTYYKCDNCKINTTNNKKTSDEGDLLCTACELENKWMEVDDITNVLFDYERLFVENIKSPSLLETNDKTKLGLSFSSASIKKIILLDTFLQGRRFIRPRDVCQNCPKLKECKESYKNSEKAVVSVNCLENLSTSDNIVATAKMDIDDLGFILYNVYPIKLNQNEVYPFSISRLSYSSWLLNLFFTQGVKEVIEKRFGNSVMILYSGGDDLLITGVWDKVIEAIKDIEMEFSEFISGRCKFIQNRDVTVTSAIVLHRAHENFDGVIETVSEGLEKAKEKKNCVFIFDEVLGYPELRDALEEAKRIEDYVRNKHLLNRAEIQKVLHILEMRKEGNRCGNQYKTIKAAALYNYFKSRHIEGNTNLNEETKREIIDFLDGLMLSHISSESQRTSSELSYNPKGIVATKIALRKLIKNEE